ncbi:MAG: hypothetical protein K6G83_02300 [Lachnospiraceae bacterium]|nr:hypothetical protein [Lachnospiraceae bacterium]
MDNKNEKKQMPPKSVMTIRLLVGMYLLYTDYSLIEGVKTRTGGGRIAIIAFMVLFFAAGVFLIIHSGKYLWEDWQRERAGGNASETSLVSGTDTAIQAEEGAEKDAPEMPEVPEASKEQVSEENEAAE